ncbi:histone deacetylase hos3 [Acrodontium crateriforme]|uniref:Histone deacetylase hos3 n=1 Tax=Acrodontium crateriforme TaxID=150365 RepID=A0AAQ3R8C3_9PEZI|nr:histone deacetylase hos3 [Acrodontium crateriforme]
MDNNNSNFRLHVAGPLHVSRLPASAPSTPHSGTTRSSSHSVASPLHHASSPRQPTLRRSSSTKSLGAQRPLSSPSQLRKNSRSSLGGAQEETGDRLTPKGSISGLVANLREARTVMESIEEPAPLTEAQVALDHFTKELLNHTQPGATAETVVILHDACYGHRWSRLKTTKATLSMIVERPERIHASILGAATAYVKLGEHHKGARNAPHPERQSNTLPPFNFRRTARTIDITSACVTNVHGTEWMSELRSMCEMASTRLAAGEQELTRPETLTTPEKPKPKLHEGDLYLATESLNAFQGALGGVADAVDAVFNTSLQTTRAFVAVRPPGHHCSADHPSGFCWLNNVHVGIEYAAQNYGLTHAAILDFDLHHGDGSQAITWERNSKNNVKRLNAKPNTKLKLSPDIGYYSLHDINSYPCEMGDDEKVQAASLCVENAHGQDVWNVHLQTWKTEDEFWALYENRYKVLIEKARSFLRRHTARINTERKVQPKAAVFISAGFDASEWEGSGMQRHKVNVPTEFYARFTRDLVQLAQEVETGCDGRVISVLEGGYSDRALCSGVLSHLSGLCASPIEAGKPQEPAGIDHSIDQMMTGLTINSLSGKDNLRYDKRWWSEANLTALELKVSPPPPPQGKKGRTGAQPTYATPTESFAYKVIDPAKFARSVSGTMRESAPVIPVVIPPPEVDWIVATQELSKLLIPTDRQTKSCTAEELGGVKIKKERQSVGPTVSPEEAAKPRQLRDRGKNKGQDSRALSSNSDELETARRPSLSGTRRQTLHELPSSTEPAVAPSPSTRRSSRRLSAGSTLSSRSGDIGINAPPVPPLPFMKPAPKSIKPPSVPTAGNVVQVKRVRPPAKEKKEVNSASAPVSPMSQRNKAASHSAMSNDVEGMTSGFKRITLKVGSREEHDRKQREREAAERKARALKGAETRRINAAAKKAAKESVSPTPTPSIGSDPRGMSPVVAVDASINSSPAQMTPTSTHAEQKVSPMTTAVPNVLESASHTTTGASVPISNTDSVPLIVHPPVQSSVLPSIGGGSMNGLHPHGLDIFPTPVTETTASVLPPDSTAQPLLQEDATALTANTPTTPSQRSYSPNCINGSPRRSSPRRNTQLPVFTSTGAIPFASVPLIPTSGAKAPAFNPTAVQSNSPPRGRQLPHAGPEVMMAQTNGFPKPELWAPGLDNTNQQGMLPAVQPIHIPNEEITEGMSICEVPHTLNAN